jgi:hypothetical protein
MYWGDEYVPLRQTRQAMLTWIGDPRVSLRQARETAQNILGQLDNPEAEGFEASVGPSGGGGRPDRRVPTPNVVSPHSW